MSQKRPLELKSQNDPKFKAKSKLRIEGNNRNRPKLTNLTQSISASAEDLGPLGGIIFTYPSGRLAVHRETLDLSSEPIYDL